MKKEIIERIKEFMLQMDFNETVLANEIGIPQRTINHYMNGARKLSLELIEAIVLKFNVNANWLLIGEGYMYKSGRDITGVGNKIKGDNKGVIGNTGTVGDVGCNSVTIGGDHDVKKIIKEGEVEIEMNESAELRQKIAHYEVRIKDLEMLNTAQLKIIETMQKLIDTLTSNK